SEEHTSELQSRENLVCRLLPEKNQKTFQFSLSTSYNPCASFQQPCRPYPPPHLPKSSAPLAPPQRNLRPRGVNANAPPRTHRTVGGVLAAPPAEASQENKSRRWDAAADSRSKENRVKSSVSSLAPELARSRRRSGQFSMSDRRPPRPALFPYTTLFR